MSTPATKTKTKHPIESGQPFTLIVVPKRKGEPERMHHARAAEMHALFLRNGHHHVHMIGRDKKGTEGHMFAVNLPEENKAKMRQLDPKLTRGVTHVDKAGNATRVSGEKIGKVRKVSEAEAKTGEHFHDKTGHYVIR